MNRLPWTVGGAVACACASAVAQDRAAPRLLPKLRPILSAPQTPDPAPATVFHADGHPGSTSDLRSVYTLYSCVSPATMFSYFPSGTFGVGQVPNGVVQGVELGTNWGLAHRVSQVNLCVRRFSTGSQTFKIFLRLWDTVNMQALPGQSVLAGQLPLSGPLDLLYANGGQGFTVTGTYTTGFNLALPPGMVPTDNTMAVEVRLVAATVTTPAEAADPANTHPAVGLDCFNATSPPIGGGGDYPEFPHPHLWIDLTTQEPTRAHDGVYVPADALSDPRGPQWTNLYLQILGQTSDCAGDFDRNGLLEPADVAGFVRVWLFSLQDGTLAGDYNGDGAVTPADVSLFLNNWLASLVGDCH